jgi:hypothetical protein
VLNDKLSVFPISDARWDIGHTPNGKFLLVTTLMRLSKWNCVKKLHDEVLDTTLKSFNFFTLSLKRELSITSFSESRLRQLEAWLPLNVPVSD